MLHCASPHRVAVAFLSCAAAPSAASQPAPTMQMRCTRRAYHAHKRSFKDPPPPVTQTHTSHIKARCASQPRCSSKAGEVRTAHEAAARCAPLIAPIARRSAAVAFATVDRPSMACAPRRRRAPRAAPAARPARRGAPKWEWAHVPAGLSGKQRLTRRCSGAERSRRDNETRRARHGRPATMRRRPKEGQWCSARAKGTGPA